MTFVSDLEPTRLWTFFDRILTIPRGSKEEERMRAFVLEIADGLGLDHDVDDTGNVVVRKPATPGMENAPGTVLQAHLDMVNEKNSDVEFDFATDAIQPLLDGDYLTADGTTLGSDNGIGVAAMLAVMEADDLTHGPLEFLFTIDEETGLTGAAGLDPELLTARRLINLDSEEEGTLTVGCAGGADTRLVLGLESVSPPVDAVAYPVKLQGLAGGHSGVDIHLQRGNAVQLLARLLRDAGLSGALAGIQGGNKHNAIPREAWATVVMPEASASERLARLRANAEAVRAEFRVPEPGMELRVEPVPLPERLWASDTGARVLDLLVALPHGVVAMSNDIAGLVETSTNLAAVKHDGDTLQVLTSSRSSIASGMEWIRAKIEAVAALAGAEAHHHDGYPGWKPDLDSELLGVVRAVHERVLGFEPHVEAIHAGLECGIIGSKYDGMDMISFGPTIKNPHSPDEMIEIVTIGMVWDLLAALLKSFK